jgi:GH43 family beta-xylosidase
MAYVDAGGAYLYFSVDVPYHSISMLPLAPDLVHAAGPRVELLTVTQPWEHGPGYATVEGPFMVQQDGTYYLFYSGNDWQHDYAMGYASATSPAGPFTKSTLNPVLSGGKDHGPGGGSLFMAGGRWMIAYHAWATEGRTLHVAPICIDAGRLRVRC